MRQAVLIGYYGSSNLGDELMLVCLNRWLQKQGIETTVIASEADVVRSQHRLPAVQNYPFLAQYGWVESLVRGKALRTLAALRRADVVLCGGGDVIRDEVGWRTFTFQVEKLVVAILLRKPVYMLNVGLSKPVTGYGRRTLRWLLPRCRGIVVRDTRSLEMCHSYGAGRHLKLLPDIVRRLADLFPESTRHASAKKTAILVALHGDSNVYGKYRMTEERIAAFAGLLDSLVVQYGLDIEFFPFQPENAGADLKIARAVRSKMLRPDSAHVLDWTLDLQEIADRFLRSRLVIAMRLHAAVLAGTYGVPCVIMPYDQKVVEFGKQAGIAHSLTAELLDQPVMALHVLADCLDRGLAPAPLERSGDWTELTLSAI